MNNSAEHIANCILSGCTGLRIRTVGIELETILYNNKGCRIPVASKTDFSSSDFIASIEKVCSANKSLLSCSLEPGGQVEWASQPAVSLHDIHREFIALNTMMLALCNEHDLFIIDLALDPIYCPQDITLINQRKYQLMHEHFKTTGHHGAWMMRNSASVQINIDLLDKNDANEVGFIADCISPLAAILFSNAPFMNDRPVGSENMRYKIWTDTDPLRCNHLLDHNIKCPGDIVNEYAQYVTQVPVIFTTPDEYNNVGTFSGTIGNWLETVQRIRQVSPADIATALHQIFTNNRYKSVLEIRACDRPPTGYELAATAFWMGLMEKENVREKLLSELLSWSATERHTLNQQAFTLDVHRPGPKNKSLLEWIEWLLDIMYTGLDNRQATLHIPSEKKYITPFVNSVFSDGIFTLQKQKQFEKGKSTIKEFVMSKGNNVQS